MLQNLEVHCRHHNSTLSWATSVLVLTTYLFKLYCNYILKYARFFKRVLPWSRFVYILLHTSLVSPLCIEIWKKCSYGKLPRKLNIFVAKTWKNNVVILTDVKRRISREHFILTETCEPLNNLNLNAGLLDRNIRV